MEKSGRDILYLCQDMREFELYGTVAAVVGGTVAWVGTVVSAGAEVEIGVVSRAVSAAIRFRAIWLRRAMNTVPAKISADTSATTRRIRETGEFFRPFRSRGRYFPLFWLVMVNHPQKRR